MLQSNKLMPLVSPTDWQRRVALSGIGLFVVLVLSLHILQPDVNVLTVPVSEYVLGPWGWLMTVAFFSLALGSWATYRTVRYTASFAGWRLGSLLLNAWIGGVAVAGCFPTDAHTVALTWHGVLHGAAATIAFFSLIFVELALVRRPVGRLLRWVSAGIGGLAIASFVFGFSIESFGLSERAVIALHCQWLTLLVIAAERQQRKVSTTQLTAE